MIRAAIIAAAGLAFCAGAGPAGAAEFDIGNIPAPEILMPAGPAAAAIVLLSGMDGWTPMQAAMADRLRGHGAIVVGIDLPSYLASLAAEDRACAYTLSSIESLSHQLQRATGSGRYHPPIIAGAGAGGAMALAIAAQTPAATVGATVSIDPEAFIRLQKPLCTPAVKTPVENGISYGLTKAPLPNPVDIVLTPAADAEGRQHATGLQAEHTDVIISESSETAMTALETALVARIAVKDGGVDDLPLAILETRPRRDLMAVIISGDGGWRDIDKKVAGYLQDEGIPSVGLDALLYFWSQKTPQQTARDLETIIDTYSRKFGTRDVVLIGYSFGANVMPSTYRQLRPAYRDKVRLVSLLALSHQADFQISVMGWLGAKGAGAAGDPVDDIRHMDPARIQCIYGLAEKDTACPALAATGADVIGIAGGHHFDGDYAALTQMIVGRLQPR